MDLPIAPSLFYAETHKTQRQIFFIVAQDETNAQSHLIAYIRKFRKDPYIVRLGRVSLPSVLHRRVYQLAIQSGADLPHIVSCDVSRGDSLLLKERFERRFINDQRAQQWVCERVLQRDKDCRLLIRSIPLHRCVGLVWESVDRPIELCSLFETHEFRQEVYHVSLRVVCQYQATKWTDLGKTVKRVHFKDPPEIVYI